MGVDDVCVDAVRGAGLGEVSLRFSGGALASGSRFLCERVFSFAGSGATVMSLGVASGSTATVEVSAAISTHDTPRSEQNEARVSDLGATVHRRAPTPVWEYRTVHVMSVVLLGRNHH